MVRGEGAGHAVYGGAQRGVAKVVGESGLSAVWSAGPALLVGAVGLASQLVVGQSPAAGRSPRRQWGLMRAE